MASPLHIASYTNVYKPEVNGVAVSVEGFRDALLKKGHQVYVFAPDSTTDLPHERFVIRYPAFDLPVQGYPMVVPMSTFADQFIETCRPDVLHANHPALLGRAAVHHSEHYSLPLVFTYHTRYHEYAHYAQPFPASKVRELITHWLGHFMASCHHLIVPSESIRRLVSDTYGLEKQVSTVATGIALERFQPGRKLEFRRTLRWKPEETVLVTCGRLAEEKNFEMVLEAVSKLPGSLPWRLVVLGEGDHLEALRALSTRLHLDDKVEFLGLVPYERVPSYLAAADLFCFASVTETQGLVTLEAMASGSAVVAVDASGTRDVVDHEVDGILTKPNSRDLAEAIKRLIGKPELRMRLATRALDKARQYSFENQTEKLLAAYHSAIDACHGGLRLHTEVHSHWEAFLDFFLGANREEATN